VSRWRSNPEQSGILLVDLQTRLLPVMSHPKELLTRARVLCQAASILSVPVYMTEQVPEKLGTTLPELKSDCIPKAIWTKETFSAYPQLLNAPVIKHWVIAGIETHICVRQTVFDLYQQGHAVTVLADVVASRHIMDRDYALEEFKRKSIHLQTLESLLFEWVETSEASYFREISQLVRAL